MTTPDAIVCIMLGIAIGLMPGRLLAGLIVAWLLVFVAPSWVATGLLAIIAVVAMTTVLGRRARYERETAHRREAIKWASHMAHAFDMEPGYFNPANVSVCPSGVVDFAPVPRAVLRRYNSAEDGEVEARLAAAAPGMTLAFHHDFQMLRIEPISRNAATVTAHQ